MNALPVSRDAWTYYEFGTRSFQDDIRTIVLNYLDQSPYRDTIPAQLREQATRCPLPFLPIPVESVTLESEPVYPYRIRPVPQLLLTVKLDEESETFTHLNHFSELMAQIGNRVAREIAADLLDGILCGSRCDGGITPPALLGQVFNAHGPDR